MAGVGVTGVGVTGIVVRWYMECWRMCVRGCVMQELGGVGWVTDLSPGAGEVVLEAARDQRVHHLKGKGGGGGEGGVRGGEVI